MSAAAAAEPAVASMISTSDAVVASTAAAAAPPLTEDAPRGGGAASSWTDRIPISTAEAMNAARRSTMEDACVVDRNFGARARARRQRQCDNNGNSNSNSNNNVDSKETILVGVYDGHGGREMVEFLQHGLSYHVAQEWFAATNDDDDDDNSNSNSNNAPAAVGKRQRLERAFLMADLHAHQVGISTSGATVALCLIEKGSSSSNSDSSSNNGDCYHVTTANVGDSRIVLGRVSNNHNHNSNHQNSNSCDAAAATATAVRLTTDHRLDDPLEVARIERAGGFLFKNRVCGVLAVTRSLGDQVLKPYVIATPSVREETVVARGGGGGGGSSNGDNNTSSGGNGASFLIVACDGLWDVLTDEEAVRLVGAVPPASDGPEDRNAAAERLVREALRRGTSDNVTAAVVWLP